MSQYARANFDYYRKPNEGRYNRKENNSPGLEKLLKLQTANLFFKEKLKFQTANLYNIALLKFMLSFYVFTVDFYSFSSG